MTTGLTKDRGIEDVTRFFLPIYQRVTETVVQPLLSPAGVLQLDCSRFPNCGRS